MALTAIEVALPEIGRQRTLVALLRKAGEASRATVAADADRERLLPALLRRALRPALGTGASAGERPVA
jgi:molybdopterin-guanine dinucleotide biosynthesis protein A